MTSITKLMTSDPTTIERSEPISEAYHVLRHAKFHHLIVVEGDEVVGMLATSDILRLAYDIDGSSERSLAAYLDHQFTIDDAMSADIQTLTTSATARDAAKLLSDGAKHSIVVLEENGHLAGIVTSTDLARFVVDLL